MRLSEQGCSWRKPRIPGFVGCILVLSLRDCVISTFSICLSEQCQALSLICFTNTFSMWKYSVSRVSKRRRVSPTAQKLKEESVVAYILRGQWCIQCNGFRHPHLAQKWKTSQWKPKCGARRVIAIWLLPIYSSILHFCRSSPLSFHCVWFPPCLSAPALHSQEAKGVGLNCLPCFLRRKVSLVVLMCSLDFSLRFMSLGLKNFHPNLQWLFFFPKCLVTWTSSRLDLNSCVQWLLLSLHRYCFVIVHVMK